MRSLVVAFLLAAHVAGSTAPIHVHPRPACHRVTAAAFRDFSRNVWRLPAWRRGSPPRRVFLAERRKVRCAAGPGHLVAMQHRWRHDRHRYRAHRRRKYEQLLRLRYLPYACGGGTRSAIPCSIMWCESGGSYTAANPTSTAYGKYQMLDTTYAEWCHACDWSPADQDRAAYELYRAAGSSPWACA